MMSNFADAVRRLGLGDPVWRVPPSDHQPAGRSGGDATPISPAAQVNSPSRSVDEYASRRLDVAMPPTPR